MRIILEGPIAGSYSLAIVNREFGNALLELGHDVLFFQRAGADPHADHLLRGNPNIYSRLVTKEELEAASPFFDLHTKNDWPMFSVPKYGRKLTAHCYGWEETLMPQKHVGELDDFDALFFMSEFSRRSAMDSGISRPCFVNGLGVDHFARLQPHPPDNLEELFSEDEKYFLHLSSGLRRKGVDVVLQAFLKEFQPDERIRLVIKTVWNESNEIYSLLDALADRDRRRVNLIDSDLENEQLKWLINRCDVICVPSRGEGFNLPAAEAMSLGKPVVTTLSGGNEDFCSERSTILISTEVTQSKSHLSVTGSGWFEPSIEGTCAAMRRAISLTAREHAILSRNAIEAVTPLTWKKAAERFLLELEKLEAGTRFPRTSPKLAVISTFNQHCGIANYTKDVIENLEKNGIETIILSEIIDTTDQIAKDPENVRRIWNRTDAGVRSIIREISALPQDCAVLLEHHPAILSWEALAAIVAKAGDGGRRQLVVELHAAATDTAGLMRIRKDLTCANALIVHSAHECTPFLPFYRNLDTRVVKMPIALRRAGPSYNRNRIFSFGICLPHKGFHRIIEYISREAATNNKIFASLICSVMPARLESVEYANFLHNLTKMYELESQIDLCFDFLPIEEVRRRAGRCQVGLFAYDDVNEGASSAVRLSIEENLITVVSPSSIFAEFEGMIYQMQDYSVASIARALEDVKDPIKRAKIMEDQRKIAAFMAPGRHSQRIISAVFDPI